MLSNLFDALDATATVETTAPRGIATTCARVAAAPLATRTATAAWKTSTSTATPTSRERRHRRLQVCHQSTEVRMSTRYMFQSCGFISDGKGMHDVAGNGYSYGNGSGHSGIDEDEVRRAATGADGDGGTAMCGMGGGGNVLGGMGHMGVSGMSVDRRAPCRWFEHGGVGEEVVLRSVHVGGMSGMGSMRDRRGCGMPTGAAQSVASLRKLCQISVGVVGSGGMGDSSGMRGNSYMGCTSMVGTGPPEWAAASSVGAAKTAGMWGKPARVTWVAWAAWPAGVEPHDALKCQAHLADTFRGEPSCLGRLRLRLLVVRRGLRRAAGSGWIHVASAV